MVTDEWLNILGSAAMIASLLCLLYLVRTAKTGWADLGTVDVSMGFRADLDEETGSISNIRFDNAEVVPKKSQNLFADVSSDGELYSVGVLDKKTLTT